MRDASDLVDIMKSISTNATNQSKPTELCIGIMQNSAVVLVDTITTNQLILMNNIVLQKDDKVALLRCFKGKKYLVLGVIND